MNSDQARNKIQKMREGGKDFDEIARRLNNNHALLDGSPIVWDADKAQEMLETGATAPSAYRSGQAASATAPAPLRATWERDVASIAIWTRVIGVIVLIWAIASVAVGIWFAVQHLDQQDDLEAALSGPDAAETTDY